VLATRRMLALRPAPEFEAWLSRVGLNGEMAAIPEAMRRLLA